MACVFHYCFTQTKREIINLVIHSLIARTDLEPHNLEVPGSSPGWSTRQKQRKLSRYKYLVAAFFLHTETPCTEFAHNLWKVVIINDKRDTPVNDILYSSPINFIPLFSVSQNIFHRPQYPRTSISACLSD